MASSTSTEEESIYKLIAKERDEDAKEAAKGPLYKSPHKDPPPKTKAGALFGPPGGTKKPTPGEFTKKGMGETKRIEAAQKAHQPKDPRVKTKPELPSKSEKGELAERTTKDYVAGNKSEATRDAPCRRPSAKEEVNWTQKPDYGKNPDYLEKVKADVAAEKAAAVPPPEKPKVRELTQEERDALIAGLKQKWETVHTQYGKLPMGSDTASTRAKKEEFERQLAVIEKDIEKLLKPHVYVENE